MTEGVERPGAESPIAVPGEPRRFRALQVASILLTVGGVVTVIAVLGANPGLLEGDGALLEGAAQAAAVLAWLMLAALAVLVGLLASAARSLVVREQLPAARYRGPSVVVMLVLAIIAANLAALSAARDVAALLGDGELTPLGTLAILTVTQLALLGSAALFVAAPRALAGVRVLPAAGLWRSVGLGLALAIPAWIGAQLIGVIVIRLLDLVGVQPEVGVAEEALARADPLILAVALVVVAPVAEEIFFRGVAYNAWLREYGPRQALFGSAILFGFIHGSVFLFVPIVGLGIMLALLYRATGSLPAAIALHAGFNGITVLLGLLVRFNVLDLPIT